MNYSYYLKERNGSLWFTETDRDNLKLNYRIRKVIYCGKSEFQHIMILDSYDFGRILVLDGIVQTTEIDGFIYNEMISHIPMSFHPCARRILIIGGGDLGAACELVKYSRIEQIDVCEIDETVVKLVREFMPALAGNSDDPRINIVFRDGVKFVEKLEPASYDIVIVDSSDPIGPAVQLFESSFYKNIHRTLKSDGLMVCQSQSPIFQRAMFEQTFQRIDKLFPLAKVYLYTVPTYPGGLFSFTLGSKIYEQSFLENCSLTDTSYVNADILEQCFLLPVFIKTMLFPNL